MDKSFLSKFSQSFKRLSEVDFLHQPNLYSKNNKILEFTFQKMPESDIESLDSFFPSPFCKTTEKEIRINHKAIDFKKIKGKDVWPVAFILILQYIQIPARLAYVKNRKKKILIELPWVRFIPKTTKKIVKILEELINNELNSEDFKNKIEKLKAFYVENERPTDICNDFIILIPKKDVPCYFVEEKIFQLGQGENSLRFRGAGRLVKRFNYRLAKHKHSFKKLARKLGLPVPSGRIVNSFKQAKRAKSSIDFPLVVKPLRLSEGKGITSNVRNFQEFEKAFKKAKRVNNKQGGKRIVIEEYLKGREYRLLCLGGAVKAVVRRDPASVIGNGEDDINQLIKKENKKRKKTDLLKKIKVPHNLKEVLKKQGFEKTSIPKAEEKVYIRENSNFSTGGKVISCPNNIIHPQIKRLTERLSRSLGMAILGVDLITKSIKKPLDKKSGFIEINGAPGIDPHITPTEGKGRPVHKMIYNYLKNKRDKFTIPIVGVFEMPQLIKKIPRILPDKVGLASSWLNKKEKALNCKIYPSSYALLLNKSVRLAVVDLRKEKIRERGMYIKHISHLFLPKRFSKNSLDKKSSKKGVIDLITSLTDQKEIVKKDQVDQKVKKVGKIIEDLL